MRSSLVCVSHWLVLMLYTGQVYYGGKSSGLLRVWWLRFLRCPRTQDKHCCAALTRTLEVPINTLSCSSYCVSCYTAVRSILSQRSHNQAGLSLQANVGGASYCYAKQGKTTAGCDRVEGRCDRSGSVYAGSG